MKKRLGEIAAYLGGTVVGDAETLISGLAGLDDAKEGDISFLANPKYASRVATTKASAVILPRNAEGFGKQAVLMDNPYLGFAKLITLFTAKARVSTGIMQGAYVSDDAVIGSEPSVYPGAYIGKGVKIGDRVTLHPGVAIYEGAVVGDDVTLHSGVSIRERCRIGNRVVIHNSTTIGSDGFGYAPDGESHYKIPQIGVVVVEDDVEIGANCAIDRAAIDITRIGKGTKIDNLVQIGHNCRIGENCLIVSQVGISGSTKIGNSVTLGGQVGIAGHITLSDRVMVAAKGGVMSSLEAGIYGGVPVQPQKEWLKSSAVYAKLPELKKRVHELEKQLEILKGRFEDGKN